MHIVSSAGRSPAVLTVALLLTTTLSPVKTSWAGPGECTLQTQAIGAGTVSVQSNDTFDRELNIEIASDLSYVRLENSELYIEYSSFVNPNVQFAIRSLVVKSVGQDQLTDSNFDYLGAGAGIGTIDSATMIHDSNERKTIRMVWNRWNVALQIENPSQKIIRDVTIFPHSRYVQIDFIDLEFAVNLADLGRPGGTSNGLHVAHGGETWPRGYTTHDEPPGIFYGRYAPSGVDDPSDGGSLNYNGHFITAVYNPDNGVGFGRVMPVDHTHVIKLLLNPGERRGLEFQNYPFLQAHPSFTGWLYVFTDGEAEALSKGRSIVDQVGTDFDCGDNLQLTARPYTNWGFTGWTGDASGSISPAPLTLTGNPTATASFEMATSFIGEDFDSYSAGEEPPNFVDTASGSSLAIEDSLFSIEVDADGGYLATNSTATNIHSTVNGITFEDGYTYTGRMRITNSQGGVGVTFFSQYPSSHTHYRLRRYHSNAFHLTASGTSFTSGTTDTEVVPTTNQWYRFTIRVEDTGSQTEVKARVWRDGALEPEGWQVDAVDASENRLSGGTVGVWSFANGAKHFDDIVVRSLNPVSEFDLTTTIVGQGSIDRTPDQSLFAFGDNVTVEAVPDPGWSFAGWSGDITSAQNPIWVAIGDDVSITATFTEIVLHSVTTTAIGQGTVTANPDQAWYEAGGIVTVSATPFGDWTFAGWSGSLNGENNPLTFAVTADTVATASFVELTSTYEEDFSQYVIGSSPAGWIDTGAHNDLATADFFEILSDGRNQYLGTSSSLTNIHSHLSSLDQTGSGYQYTGRMRMSNSSCGIGVTFFSQFTSSAGYYRLRRYGTNSFHLTSLGAGSLIGVTDTGVLPVPNAWYRFRVEVDDRTAQTTLRARVWLDGTSEPMTWQANAVDPNPTRYESGTIGVWSYLSGEKCWDDLRVLPLNAGPAPPPETFTLEITSTGAGSVTVDPSAREYDAGSVVQLTANPNPGWRFVQWQGTISGSTNPRDVVMASDSTINAIFAEIVQHSVTTRTIGRGAIDLNPSVAAIDAGSALTITAIPSTGWRFVGWQGSLSGTQNPTTVTVEADVVAIAEFAEITQHTVDITVLGEGTVTRNPDHAVYDFGTALELTATPDPGWLFSGWSGDLTSSENPLVIEIDGDYALDATFVEPTGYLEDFESYPVGGNASSWIDTDSQNSLTENDSLFSVYEGGANQYLGTNSTATNIHSHLTGVGLPSGGYQFYGRMKMSDSQSGIGVTFFSDFPNSTNYYRLRRYFDNSFHITANGTSITGGETDSLLVPVADQWYSFRIEVEDTGSRTTIRSRIWLDGTPEPTTWPIDCFDNTPTRLTSGTIGVWAFYNGSKCFDDTTVEPLGSGPPQPPATDLTLTVSAVGDGLVTVSPDQLVYQQGDPVDLTALPDPNWQFAGWTGDVTTSENPLSITMTDDVSVTAIFALIPVGAVYSDDFEAYSIGGDPTNWLDTQAGNSLLSGDDFEVIDSGGNQAFISHSTATNIHSHYDGSLPVGGYTLRGRMRTSASSGGIGVTFFSDFPNSVKYYRLRRYFTNSFHISPMGTTVSGDVDSGVTPDSNTWYRFLIRVEDSGLQTDIRAKVWVDGTAEPVNWQIDCFDDSVSRQIGGTIGTWGFHSGTKSWDDFEVSPLN